MTANLTMTALLAEGVRRLTASPAGAGPSGNPDLDAQVLLAHALQISRARLRSHPETLVEEQRVPQYRELLERRAAGEPLAYLTGWREFWSLRLAVSPAVLVPRPETELLVERALALRGAPGGRVAELGTGSGAVAVALASERPGWQLTATDVSREALEVARDNAAALGLTRIEFRQGSWFEPLAAERFDLLLSNPPYVAADDPALSSPALVHEPRLALTPGADALECLRAIVRGAARHLATQGWLVLEHGADQAAHVRRELVAAGFRSVRSHRDLAGHERVTEGQHGQI
jgi:release factor glutamine methyltransferase